MFACILWTNKKKNIELNCLFIQIVKYSHAKTQRDDGKFTSNYSAIINIAQTIKLLFIHHHLFENLNNSSIYSYDLRNSPQK
jgi:hypothetical protein